MATMESDKASRNGNDNDLTRQLTLQLSADQYERLFFQPTAAKGDLAKRLGNPTLLGILGFLIPYSTTIFCLLEFRGANVTSLTGVSGCFYFLGGIAMTIAGICEFILGNTFPFVVFIVYGAHWCNVAFTSDPAHNLLAAYGPNGTGAVTTAYNSGQASYNIVLAMVSFIFFLGSLRTNLPFVLIFFCLVFLFSFLAAADYTIGYSAGAELAYATKLIKVGAGFGFVAVVLGWYLAIITVCASTGVPCPLPIFDLSQKAFKHNKSQKGEHAGSVRDPNIQA